MPKIIDVSKGEKIALFTTLALEVNSLCNRSCHFCPNVNFKRDDVYMEWDVIKKVISELKFLKYKGRQEWYIYSEPTRCKHLVEIIAYYKKELPHTCQMINTNGDYFKSKDDIMALFDAGLNQMQINIYSAADKHQTGPLFDKGVEMAKKREVLMQRWLDELTEEGRIVQDLSLYQNIGSVKKCAKVVNKYGIKNTFTDKDAAGPNTWSNRVGLIEGFKDATVEPLNKYCTRPFRFLNINFNGDSILCCNDYYGNTNFGNVKTHTLVEIWNNANFHIYRLKLQNKKRDCYLCDVCDFKGGYYPHMTDKVTFGETADAAILATDLRTRESIFDFPVAFPKEKQGKTI